MRVSIELETGDAKKKAIETFEKALDKGCVFRNKVRAARAAFRNTNEI